MKKESISIRIVSTRNWIKIIRGTLHGWNDLQNADKIVSKLHELDGYIHNSRSYLYINKEYRGIYSNNEIKNLILSKVYG